MGIAEQIRHGGKYFPAHELQGLIIPKKKLCACGWALPRRAVVGVIATKENFLPNKGILGVMVTMICPSCDMPWRVIQNQKELTPA